MDGHEATYTVSLAVFDLLPVVLGVVGYWFLARLASRAVPGVRIAAFLGVALVAAGGLSKAFWKVILTTTDTDVAIMEQALFPLLATGLVLLAWAVWSGLVGREVVVWPFAVLLAVGIAGALAARTMQPLLGVAATFALVVSGLGVRWGLLVRALVPAGLFVVGMASSIALAYLGSPRVEQTLGQQWTEETVNFVGQLCFLVASALLLRAVERTGLAASRAATVSSVDA